MTKQTKAAPVIATASTVSPAKLRGMFGSNGTAMGRAELKTETILAALGRLLAPFVKDGKLVREVKPHRDAWIAAYAKVRGIAPDSDGARQAWSRYSRSAIAGSKSLEGVQSRGKVAKAKGSDNKPKGTALPGEVIAANTAAPSREPGLAESMADASGAVPLSAGQGLALLTNNARGDCAALGEVLAKLDSKSKHLPELMAAFNRLHDTLAKLEKQAVKVLTARAPAASEGAAK